eukprot:7221721-Pyramimonas_sp.AAC.1
MAPTQDTSTEVSALPKLRTVDAFKDDGVWVALVEGCNSRCHSKAWAPNAEGKFEKVGFYLTWVQTALDVQRNRRIGREWDDRQEEFSVSYRRFSWLCESVASVERFGSSFLVVSCCTGPPRS